MADNALSFISSRLNPVSITRERIEAIIWYSIECYLLLLKGKPSYSKQHVKDSTTFSFEDYLKMELVDEYLVKNKSLLKGRVSALEEIHFTYETVKRYTDASGKEKSDKIDIYINKLGLKDFLKVDDEYVYFVFECKRVGQLSDTSHYVADIQKFADRKHAVLRLPFEGMIAFIENTGINHTQVAEAVNKKLQSTSTIQTTQYLTAQVFHIGFNGSYLSVHKKNYVHNEEFSIYHLLLDYSTCVVK